MEITGDRFAQSDIGTRIDSAAVRRNDHAIRVNMLYGRLVCRDGTVREHQEWIWNQIRYQFMPDPVVRLHPDDAEARGITDGAQVRVFNQFGEVTMKAEITNLVLPGVVDVFHGWHQADINLLTTRSGCLFFRSIMFWQSVRCTDTP